MKLSTATLISACLLVISIGSLLVYCGVLKEKIHVNELNIIALEATVFVQEKELTAEIEKKVDIVVFNEANKNLCENLKQLREDNLRDHDKIEVNLGKISEKIDRLIERK